MTTGAAVPESSRVVCQFSCGAASAVATKLALAQYGKTHDVQIVNAFIQQEHPDNRRFLADCERWFGYPITVLRDEKYGASTVEVYRREQFMKSQRGAPCSRFLKRQLLDRWKRHDDVMVLGFTVEEEDRYEDILDRFPTALAPLIDKGLTKGDCLAMVERAGIELPAMYHLGYNNANCIGCVKGGEGYWNKIRRDFPARFEEMAAVQESIGPGAYLFRNRETGERFSLRELDPSAGRNNEVLPECSFFCIAAEQEYAA
jgi:3'-phosphoadenosine 5'-phosphosulfate sulfotransferase (PAPS reductase)/FAD synthetase